MTIACSLLLAMPIREEDPMLLLGQDNAKTRQGRQTDRQTGRQTDRQTDRQTNFRRQIDRLSQRDECKAAERRHA